MLLGNTMTSISLLPLRIWFVFAASQFQRSDPIPSDYILSDYFNILSDYLSDVGFLGPYRIGIDCSIRRCRLYHTPLVRFSKLDCYTAKRVPIPNDAPSESSRRYVSSADTVPSVEISTMENRPWGGWCYIHRPIQSYSANAL